MTVTGTNLIARFLNPTSVQRTQGNRAFTGMTNPAKSAAVASVPYERAPKQGASVPVTDANGNPLLAGYMPDGLKLDCFA